MHSSRNKETHFQGTDLILSDFSNKSVKHCVLTNAKKQPTRVAEENCLPSIKWMKEKKLKPRIWWRDDEEEMMRTIQLRGTSRWEQAQGCQSEATSSYGCRKEKWDLPWALRSRQRIVWRLLLKMSQGHEFKCRFPFCRTVCSATEMRYQPGVLGFWACVFSQQNLLVVFSGECPPVEPGLSESGTG